MSAAGTQEPVSAGLFDHQFEVLTFHAVRTPYVLRFAESPPFEQEITSPLVPSVRLEPHAQAVQAFEKSHHIRGGGSRH